MPKELEEDRHTNIVPEKVVSWTFLFWGVVDLLILVGSLDRLIHAVSLN